MRASPIVFWLLGCMSASAQMVSQGQNGSGYYAIYQGYPNTALTGTTSETIQASIRIPANTLGATGAIRVTANWTMTNNANAKNLFIRLGASGNTSTGSMWISAPTTSAGYQTIIMIRAAGAANAQSSFPAGAGGVGGSSGALSTAAVDTTADSFVNINGQLAVGTDTLTLVGYSVEVMHP
jgi:hypothetical protein